MIMTDPDLVRAYMLAGAAKLTIKSLATGVHYTYRISRVKEGEEKFFVGTLVEGDSFAYTGLLDIPAREFRVTRKSEFAENTAQVKTFRWFLSILMGEGRLPKTAEVRHEGTCGRCARPLTHPDSIDRGIGPECIKHMECSHV